MVFVAAASIAWLMADHPVQGKYSGRSCQARALDNRRSNQALPGEIVVHQGVLLVIPYAQSVLGVFRV